MRTKEIDNKVPGCTRYPAKSVSGTTLKEREPERGNYRKKDNSRKRKRPMEGKCEKKRRRKKTEKDNQIKEYQRKRKKIQ